MPGECATSTATYETTPVTSATRTQMEILARRLIMGPNDEVERRGASPASNEGTLSQSSTPSLAHRRRGPRSLEPIVREHAYPLFAVGLCRSRYNAIHCAFKDQNQRHGYIGSAFNQP